MKYCIVSLLLLQSLNVANGVHSPASRYKVKFFYLPFDRQTYVPIDEKGIEDAYDLTSCLQSKSSEIIKLIQDAPKGSAPFTHNVRLKIVLYDGSSICVDETGGTENLSKSGKILPVNHKLSKESLLKMRRVIKETTPHA